MKIEDKLTAIKSDVAASTGVAEMNDITIEVVDMASGIARTGDGGATIVFDRAHAESSDNETLRFCVQHELMHAMAMRRGGLSGPTSEITVTDADGQFNADIMGAR